MPPTFEIPLFPSSIHVWNESKILARIMYKTRNQHRSTFYYHKFQAIMRSLKQLLKVELYLQECFESRNDLAKEALDEQLARFQSLCNKLAEDCIKAFRYYIYIFKDFRNNSHVLGLCNWNMTKHTLYR